VQLVSVAASGVEVADFDRWKAGNVVTPEEAPTPPTPISVPASNGLRRLLPTGTDGR
jgi:hypothetical protein